MMNLPLDSHEDSNDYESSSQTSVESRPNKFRGPDSTWRFYTQEERTLALSMDKIRDQDLAAHLYNAHAMKRVFYDPTTVSNLKPWSSKDRWLKTKIVQDNVNTVPFVPPRAWTAWPLDPSVVPRSGEHIGPCNSEDRYTMGNARTYRPSGELEDILTATMTKFAKEHWEAREWESPTDVNEIVPPDQTRLSAEETPKDDKQVNSEEVIESVPVKDVDENSLDESRKSSPVRIATFTRLSSIDSLLMEGRHTTTRDIKDMDSSPNQDIRASDEGGSEKYTYSTIDNKDSYPKPVITTDDDTSARVLRPTVRHTLSQLDNLLMALHHARQTCLNYGSDASGSQSEFDSQSEHGSEPGTPGPLNDQKRRSQPGTPGPVEEQEIVLKKPRGRPRKTFTLPDLNDGEVSASQNTDGQRKRSSRGRKRKVYEPLEGESHHEMLVRIARIQKQPLPFTSPTPNKVKNERSMSRSGSRRRFSSVESQSRRKKRLGLRDWSEVLGTAALVGFPSEAVDRATQRCTTLFGECMDMRYLIEQRIGEGDGPVVRYTPDQIPNLENFNNDIQEPAFELPSSTGRRPRSQIRSYASRRRPNRSKSSRSKSRYNTSEGGKTGLSDQEFDDAYWCPYIDCVRHDDGFRQRHHLRSHLQRAHKLTEDEQEKALFENQDEMYGAVHIDGFLKPLKRRRRGKDSAPRNRRKRAYKTDRDDSGESMNGSDPGELSERDIMDIEPDIYD